MTNNDTIINALASLFEESDRTAAFTLIAEEFTNEEGNGFEEWMNSLRRCGFRELAEELEMEFTPED